MSVGRIYLLLLLLVSFAGSVYSQESCDHQDEDYIYKFRELNVYEKVWVKPFFSPDHSIDVYPSLIESAKKSIDIATPHFKSWAGSKCDVEYSSGCSATMLRNDSSPIFASLLNALHRRVKVRILTNECNYPSATRPVNPYWLKEGEEPVSTYTFLLLNGADVRAYTHTTFMHEKYLAIDGEEAAISSVNISPDAFMKNRESGVVVKNQNLLNYFNSVFEHDFNEAICFLPKFNYSEEEKAIITDETAIDVVIPSPSERLHCGFITEQPTYIEAKMSANAFAGPDCSRETLLAIFDTVMESIHIYIYQLEEWYFCDRLANMSDVGIDVKLLVSANVLGDLSAQTKCYEHLLAHGITVMETDKDCYEFAHEKFIIVDDNFVLVFTGNMDETDFPDSPGRIPLGTHANRDMNLKFDNREVVKIFSMVLSEDSKRGKPWTPPKKSALMS